jgi:hypothetical protein
MAPCAAAETLVGGSLGTGTWTPAGNPYHVTANLVVPIGSTLTIEAGTHVIVDNAILFVVDGSLFVNGTAANPVTFSPAAGPGPGRWGGLIISGPRPSTIDHASIGGTVQAIQIYDPGTGVTIKNSNLYDFSGTGIRVFDGSPTIDADFISSASVSSPYGIIIVGSGGATITNVVLRDLFVGIFVDPDVFTTTNIRNTTIDLVGPSATHYGVGIRGRDGSGLHVTIANTVIAGAGSDTFGVFSEAGAGAVIQLNNNDVVAATPYSAVAAGPGSISVAPMFVSFLDFHLQAGSPLIDAGSASGAPDHDFDGEARPLGAGVDIGADEFTAPIAPPTANAGPDQTFTADASGSASVTLTGFGTSSDPAVRYRWQEGTALLATTASFTRLFTTGVHLLTFTVADTFGQSAFDTVLIGIVAAGAGGVGPPGPAGPAGPAGNSVQMQAEPPSTACAAGGVRLQIVDLNNVAIGSPLYVCNGANGAKGDKGDTGDTGDKGDKGDKGDPGAPGGGLAVGSYLFMAKGAPVPAGYRFVGSTKQVVPGSGNIDIDVYIKR